MARTPSPPPPPSSGLDPTFDVDAAPRVGGRTSLWPVAFGIVGALALGTVVFLQLDGSRTAIETAKLAKEEAAKTAEAQRLAAAAAPAPQPVMPAYIPPPAPIVEPVVQEQPPPPSPPPPPAGPTQAELDRLRAPALVVDLGQYQQPAPAGAAPAVGPDGKPLNPADVTGAMSRATATLNPDEQFAQRLGVGDSSKPQKAGQIRDPANTVVEGSLIAAVLETALNSDIPGYVRAVVTREVRGFDGKKVLIPRGSRLIGQYKSGVALGQSRTFVIWTRLLRPDGVSIDLSSPATDGLGRGGLDGDVDTHFFERFGGAMLLSLFNLAGGALIDSSDTNIVIASTRSGMDAGGSALTSGTSIAPTVTVPQGSPVRVFVSQDLDFSSVAAVKADAN